MFGNPLSKLAQMIKSTHPGEPVTVESEIRRIDSEQDATAAALSAIAKKVSTDFISRNTQENAWSANAINGGTVVAGDATVLHPGIAIYKSHESNANSGYRYFTDIYNILLGGGEKSTIVFKTKATLIGVKRRIGFQDSTSETNPTDGVYCEIANGVLTGKTANNGTLSTTSTSYTLAANTWYRLKIELNSDASLATFTLYEDNTNTVLWQNTLSENIPTGAARWCGHGDICILASPAAATEIGTIDYMDLEFPNSRRLE